jgi:3-phenylpropionate/cinnamic acid dioxygenase small subunit
MTVESEISQLVYREARLLDEWKLEEWLTLFTEDGIYWLPIDENSDPRIQSSIIYDDKLRRTMRIDQLISGRGPSQTPRSEMVHIIGNLEIANGGPNEATARYNMLVTELRPGDWRQAGMGTETLYSARCTLALRREAGEWRMKEKRVVLLKRNQPVGNLSFIL